MYMLLYQLLLWFPLLFSSNNQQEIALRSVVPDDYIKIKWNDLARMNFEKRYSKELKQMMPFPIFHESVKALDGKKVMIAGYLIPLDETTDQPIVVLSAYPFSSCFFCGGAGPESVMDIKPKGGMDVDMDRRVTLKGTLELNSDDLYSLYYILHDAEIVN